MQTVTMLRRSPDATLKEKLKEHYQSRDFAPSQTSMSRGGLVTVGCGIFSLFLECLVLLIPTIYFGHHTELVQLMSRSGFIGERWWAVLLLVVFVWAEVTWNWWRVYYDVPNWVTKDTKAKMYGNVLDTPEGWKHCPTCQLDAPPRSHHCSHCGHCVLKRDQHCFFTSSCVGFHTQRHFTVFLYYIIVGCLLGLYLQLCFLQLSFPLPDQYLAYLPPAPIMHLFAGKMGVLEFIVMVHVYVNIAFMGIAATCLLWQLVIIMRGQTSYEAWRNIRTYDLGLWGNITAVFGSPLQMLTLFFAPLMLPLKDDGIKWHAQPKSGKTY